MSNCIWCHGAVTDDYWKHNRKRNQIIHDECLQFLLGLGLQIGMGLLQFKAYIKDFEELEKQRDENIRHRRD